MAGLFGNDGLKADVQISLAPKTYFELGGTIFVASLASFLAIYAIKKFTGSRASATGATGGQVQIGPPAATGV